MNAGGADLVPAPPVFANITVGESTSPEREKRKMKYCNNCGKEVSDNAVVCPFCGCAVASKNVEVDKPSTGLNILSFLIPLVGLILYLSWQNSTPIKAKAVGKWALIGFCVAVGLSIISAIVSGAFLSSMIGSMY